MGIALTSCFAESDKLHGEDSASGGGSSGTTNETSPTTSGVEFSTGQAMTSETASGTSTSGISATSETLDTSGTESSVADDSTIGVDSGDDASDSRTGSQPCVHRFFVTRQAYTGQEVGSVDLASLRCQMEADAGLGGTWRAVLSDDDQAAILHLSLCGDVILGKEGNQPGQALVATQQSWWGTHSAPINRFADGGLLDQNMPPVVVWSGTKNDGFPSEYNCEDWSSNSSEAWGQYGWAHNLGIGSWNLGIGSWIADGARRCDTEARLYRLEQF